MPVKKNRNLLVSRGQSRLREEKKTACARGCVLGVWAERVDTLRQREEEKEVKRDSSRVEKGMRI